MRIVITNDDNHASSLLHMLVDYLSTIAEVTVVVPLHQQSWKGKSVTRYQDIAIKEGLVAGHKAYIVDGTPADCANIAIHHLVAGPPDLVVSGINQGKNTGVGFLLASGTLGACIEANIAGIPAIALSQDLNWDLVRHTPEGWFDLDEASTARIGAQYEIILPDLFKRFFDRPELLSPKVAWNVNFPIHLADNWNYQLVSAAHNYYGNLFSKRADASAYYHDLRVISRDERHAVDSEVVSSGHVSITPISIADFGQLSSARAGELKHFFE